MNRVIKLGHPDLIVQQQLWYRKVPAAYKPTHILERSSTSYSYDMAPGIPLWLARNNSKLIERARRTAVDVLWKKPAGQLSATRCAMYREHLFSTVSHEIYTRELQEMVAREVVPERLTLAAMCHGDFTLENILWDSESDALIFIDPADDHNLKCRELDESKLMQSTLTDWETLAHKTGEWSFPDDALQYSPALLALCATHWMRLYRHQKQRPWVQEKVPEILAWLHAQWQARF